MEANRLQFPKNTSGSGSPFGQLNSSDILKRKLEKQQAPSSSEEEFEEEEDPNENEDAFGKETVQPLHLNDTDGLTGKEDTNENDKLDESVDLNIGLNNKKETWGDPNGLDFRQSGIDPNAVQAEDDFDPNDLGEEVPVNLNSGASGDGIGQNTDRNDSFNVNTNREEDDFDPNGEEDFDPNQ